MTSHLRIVLFFLVVVFLCGLHLQPDVATLVGPISLQPYLKTSDITNIQVYPAEIHATKNEAAKRNRRGTYSMRAHKKGNVPPLSEFRLARLDHPKPELGKGLVPYDEHGHFYSPRYQCAGKEYDAYMARAARMVEQRVQMTPKAKWGRRPLIAPPSAQNILIMGNSHTRQVAVSLEWQYQDLLTSTSFETISMYYYRLSVGPTTLHVVYNHPCAHSARWKENLEEHVLQKPLTEFDAIVMGTLNPYSDRFNTTGLWVDATNYAQENPQQEIDLHAHPKGFKFPDLMSAYKGPLVFLSSFRRDQNWLYKRYWQQAQNATRTRTSEQRTNVRVVHSRAAIDAIGWGDCAHDSKPHVATCNATLKNKHMCMGDKGGIPDFVAWDLIEALYDVLR